MLMWIAALDELLEKLSVDDFPFERVRAISGAGQVSAMRRGCISSISSIIGC